MNTPNQIDISIIIPIYNVEKYLTVCIDSLMNQGDLRMEIIMVNDGSTDLSGEIADEYAKKEERIKVIHQENGGASAARNVGLDIATGEYIAFLDSDDWIKDESLSLLYAFKFIYIRNYLHKIQARFEEGIMHEDELWCPIVLCQAERMVITNIEFYYYRQNEESVMHTTSLARRLKSLFQVTEGLIKFSDQFVSQNMHMLP